MIKTCTLARLQQIQTHPKYKSARALNTRPGNFTDINQLNPDGDRTCLEIPPRRQRLLPAHALVTLVLCASAANLPAAVIFMDDFERSNSSMIGAEWQELERDNNDVAIYNSQLRLRDQSGDAIDAAVIHSADTLAFENLTLSFDWRATSNTEASDTLYLGWYSPGDTSQASTWTSLWSQALGGSDYVSQSVSVSAASNTLANLAFWIDVSSATETVYLDNILLEGDPLSGTSHDSASADPVISVNEPSSSLLLLSGVLGLLGYRKRIQSSTD